MAFSVSLQPALDMMDEDIRRKPSVVISQPPRTAGNFTNKEKRSSHHELRYDVSQLSVGAMLSDLSDDYNVHKHIHNQDDQLIPCPFKGLGKICGRLFLDKEQPKNPERCASQLVDDRDRECYWESTREDALPRADLYL